MTALNAQRKIQELLAAGLPGKSSQFHYRECVPGDELAYRVVYVKFKLCLSGFLDLMSEIGALNHDRAIANPYLPAAWSTEPGVIITWWDPNPETPREAAARSYGLNGWIAAKHERGWVYLIAKDTRIRGEQ